ncbi:MAG: EscR/YscR/HrcR family type III secretion system export apparatus protein [Candidatus Eremiobacteraeota bacterium]|nr:EscR/YscR/HrcR family type III secretion system export apparatus protein [Candidatus Eremiobacteraeota bacterium]
MNELLGAARSAPQGGSPVDLLAMFFLLGLVPLLAVSTTSFARIVVVLGLLRSSLGAASLPPNAVIVALAMMLTGAVMNPTLTRINAQAVKPYFSHRLSQSQALERGADSLREFMQRQVRPSDVAAFARIARVPLKSAAAAPFAVVAPAFMVGELRAAFTMDFALALPFAVVDIVVSAVLMSLGMFMVSPAVISLPIKLLLFVLADGWTLVAGALVASYR